MRYCLSFHFERSVKISQFGDNLPQGQALETQRLIKRQFEQFHQVLYEEESKRIAAVKKEEDERLAGMKNKIKELSAEVQFIAEAILTIQEQLQEEDMVLLKVCPVENKSASSSFCPKTIHDDKAFFLFSRILKIFRTGRSKCMDSYFSLLDDMFSVRCLFTEEKTLSMVQMTCQDYCLTWPSIYATLSTQSGRKCWMISTIVSSLGCYLLSV